MRNILSSIAICTVSLVSLLALTGCDKEKATASAPAEELERVVRVETATVTPTPLKDLLILPGETEPDEDVSVSSESAGTVKWLGVKEGDRVQKGVVMARVDVPSSGARLDQARANRALAAEQLRRRRELLEKGVLAKEEFDQMAAKLQQTDASLREMQVGVDNGVIRAPLSGIVNKLHVDQGERLAVGSRVVDIVDPAVIRININVPEMDVPFIKKGQKVAVTVDAIPGHTWEGEVEFVSFKADPTSKTFETKVLVTNADGAIRAGMLARVALKRRTIEQAVTAPLYAIINQGGERLLYVVEDGRARARTIELGVISEDHVQVVKGLSPGEELIISGQSMVEDGTKVETL